MSTPTQLREFNIAYIDAMLFSLFLYVPILLILIRYLQWKMLIQTLQGYFPLGVVFSVLSILQLSHPFAELGALTLGMFISLGYLLLYYYHNVWKYARQVHTMLLWFIVVVLSLELRYHTHLLSIGESIAFVEYIGYFMVIAGTLSAAYVLEKYAQLLSILDTYIAKIFLILAILLWMTSTTGQLVRFEILHHHAMLISFILGAVLLFGIAKRLEWKIIMQILQGYLLFGVALWVFTLLKVAHPFEGVGAMVWGTFMLLNYLFLHQYDKVWKYTKSMHILSVWFITAVLTLEFIYQVKQWFIAMVVPEHVNLLSLQNDIVIISMAVVPLVLSMLLLVPKRYTRWLENYRDVYQVVGVGGLIIVLMLWEIRVFRIALNVQEIPYLPIVNVLDMIQILVLGMVGYWVYRNKAQLSSSTKVSLYGFLAFMTTLLTSVVFARAVHHFEGVAYTLSALWDSIYFQTGLSILWSLVAIVLMFLSKRYKNSPLWFAGFGLLVIVVLKLFFVELANSGTIERIVSFIAVGSLLLLIGYFVPLPPNESKEEFQGEKNE